jgi:hypothetical protein
MPRMPFSPPLPRRPHHPEDDLVENSLAGVLYDQFDLAQLEVLHDALCGVPITPADVPAEMLAEVEAAIKAAAAPPREPAPEPEWMRNALWWRNPGKQTRSRIACSPTRRAR